MAVGEMPRQVDLQSKVLACAKVDPALVIAKVQSTVFPRRLRIRDVFVDYDPRRSLRCTRQQFIRALDYAAIKVTYDEATALADHFRDAPSGDVNYGTFSDEVNLVFGTQHLEQTPLA